MPTTIVTDHFDVNMLSQLQAYSLKFIPMDPDEAIKIIRDAQHYAFWNEHLASMISKLIGYNITTSWHKASSVAIQPETRLIIVDVIGNVRDSRYHINWWMVSQ